MSILASRSIRGSQLRDCYNDPLSHDRVSAVRSEFRIPYTFEFLGAKANEHLTCGTVCRADVYVINNGEEKLIAAMQETMIVR